MDEGFYTCMAGNTIGETVSQVNSIMAVSSEKLLEENTVFLVKKEPNLQCHLFSKR